MSMICTLASAIRRFSYRAGLILVFALVASLWPHYVVRHRSYNFLSRDRHVGIFWVQALLRRARRIGHLWLSYYA